MKMRHLTSALTALVLAGAMLVGPSGAAQADGDGHELGTRSLAKVLAADGNRFDKNPRDFDIVDRLVRRVLAAKPKSRLGILARGGQRLTAFLPTDAAMRRSLEVITGQRYIRERRVFKEAWSAAGLRTTESILLQHLVRGATITYDQARSAAPTRLTTMQGGTLRIRVRDGRLLVIDANPDSPNARVIPAMKNINKGNRQIAHGINWLLSP